jgi:Peptide arylation enzymes
MSLTLEELTKFLLDAGMAKFKLPERLELMEDFPISTFGKVSKKVLSESLRASGSTASAG